MDMVHAASLVQCVVHIAHDDLQCPAFMGCQELSWGKRRSLVTEGVSFM